jgi:tetratricopeptide (TPR) repeat protein
MTRSQLFTLYRLSITIMILGMAQVFFEDQPIDDLIKFLLIGVPIGMGIALLVEYRLALKYPRQTEALIPGIFYVVLCAAVIVCMLHAALFFIGAVPAIRLPFGITLLLTALIATLLFVPLYLAHHLIAFKQYDAALKLNTLLLKLPFRKLSGHIQRGNIYQHHLKQPDKALIEYEAALTHARKPSMKAVALSWHSNVLTETLQMERALDDANAMVALNIYQDIAYQIRGYIRMYLGDDAAARADIETGLQHSKTPGAEPTLIATRGILYAKEGDFDTAHADFKQALKGLPEQQVSGLRSVIYQYMGRTYFAQGDYDAALTAFNKAQDAEPEMTPVLIDQALTQAALGEPQLARELWHMAHKTDARLVTDISWLAQRNYFWCPPMAQAYRDFAATMN